MYKISTPRFYVITYLVSPRMWVISELLNQAKQFDDAISALPYPAAQQDRWAIWLPRRISICSPDPHYSPLSLASSHRLTKSGWMYPKLTTQMSLTGVHVPKTVLPRVNPGYAILRLHLREELKATTSFPC